MARPYFSSVILPKPEADPIPEPSQPPARHQLTPDYPEYGPPPFKPRKRHDYGKRLKLEAVEGEKGRKFQLNRDI